ncbi:MAG: hypothetical protein HQK72_04115 [Desulfamplus sp.]|nr:hypothetical protein [Desulfamplus sp.]
MNIKKHTDLVKEIVEIANFIPLEQTLQLYKFALILKSQASSHEEVSDNINIDEELWKAQFAKTSDDKLANLVKLVETEIDKGATMPMFNKNGDFIECQ